MVIRSLILTFLTLLFFNCEGDISLDYKFTDMTVENAENTGVAPMINSLDSIPASAYVIRINLFPVEVSKSKGRYFDTETPPRNTNWPQAIEVSANIDFDTTHLAGTSLSDYFLIFNHSYMYTSTLDDPFITNRYSHLYYEEPMPNYAYLLLMEVPEVSGDYIFTVSMELNDGTIYIDSTTVIRIYK